MGITALQFDPFEQFYCKTSTVKGDC